MKFTLDDKEFETLTNKFINFYDLDEIKDDIESMTEKKYFSKSNVLRKLKNCSYKNLDMNCFEISDSQIDCFKSKLLKAIKAKQERNNCFNQILDYAKKLCENNADCSDFLDRLTSIVKHHNRSYIVD